MKIGIITLWNQFDNYGGIIQTFALQRYLRDLGHDAFVVRFGIKRPQPLKVRLKETIKSGLRCCGLYAQKKISKIEQQRKERNFIAFRNRYIKYSKKPFYNLEYLQHNYPKADVYITGSDQVWARSLENREEEIYYLNFGNKETKRIAYAVSFGFNEFPCVDEKRFRELVGHFDAVSVREKNGLEICNERSIPATRCIDPTFLVNPETYKKFCLPVNIPKIMYIYIR